MNDATRAPKQLAARLAWPAILALVAAMLVAGGLFATPAHAAGTANLSVSGGNVGAGQSLTVTVSASGLTTGDNFNGYEVGLKFDPGILRATVVTGRGSWNTSLVRPVIDNSAGTVQVVAVSTSASCAPACELFAVTFTGQVAGASGVSILSAQLATTSGGALAVQSSTAGTVSVTGTAPATPTTTATATTTATTTTTATATASASATAATPTRTTTTSTPSTTATATSTTIPGGSTPTRPATTPGGSTPVATTPGGATPAGTAPVNVATPTSTTPSGAATSDASPAAGSSSSSSSTAVTTPGAPATGSGGDDGTSRVPFAILVIVLGASAAGGIVLLRRKQH